MHVGTSYPSSLDCQALLVDARKPIVIAPNLKCPGAMGRLDTNGVFFAAALAEGFHVKRDGNSPNALLNISKATWGRGWRRGDQETFFDKPYAERLAAAKMTGF